MKRLLGKSVVLAIIIVTALKFGKPASAAQQVSIIDLGSLPGENYSFAYGINYRGQVVGVGDTASGDVHAVLWQDGTITDLGTLPGGFGNNATGINNRGQIVGAGVTAVHSTHAVLWEVRKHRRGKDEHDPGDDDNDGGGERYAGDETVIER